MSDDDPAQRPDGRGRALTRQHVDSDGMLSAQTAMGLLETSTADVWARVHSGQLDGYVLAGALWLHRDQVEHRANLEREESVRQMLDGLRVAEEVLRAYLADRPVVATLDEAQETGRPLLAAARGRSDRVTGVARHAVLVRIPTLVEYATDRISQAGLDGSPWSILPGGDSLRDLLKRLGGVTEQQNVTGIGTPGQTRRVYSYLRLDSTMWPPTVPDDVWPLITGRVVPSGAEGPAALAAQEPAGRPDATDDPWADVTTDAAR